MIEKSVQQDMFLNIFDEKAARKFIRVQFIPHTYIFYSSANMYSLYDLNFQFKKIRFRFKASLTSFLKRKYKKKLFCFKAKTARAICVLEVDCCNNH